MDKNIDMKNKKNKENPLPLMKRLLGYILKNYKFSCIAVHSCFSAYNTDSNAVYPEAY